MAERRCHRLGEQAGVCVLDARMNVVFEAFEVSRLCATPAWLTCVLQLTTIVSASMCVCGRVCLQRRHCREYEVPLRRLSTMLFDADYADCEGEKQLKRAMACLLYVCRTVCVADREWHV